MEIKSQAYASTLFAPDSDSAMLFQIVTNTASQLNELEKLITNAEKYTGLMEKYNEIAKDHYFRAERIYYIAQNYVELSGRDPKDLESLNSAIRALKSETQSLESAINEYREDEAINETQENEIIAQSKLKARELNFANSQVDRTAHVSSTNEAQKLTAQNTGLIYKNGVENHQVSQLIASKITEQNKLLNREKKDEAKVKLEREQYYKLQDRKSKRRRGEK